MTKAESGVSLKKKINSCSFLFNMNNSNNFFGATQKGRIEERIQPLFSTEKGTGIAQCPRNFIWKDPV